MLFGGDHTIWMLRGDPADGGVIDNVSRSVGVAGPEAWATDGQGGVYFMSRDGLYRLLPKQGLECLSGQAMAETFSTFDLTASRVRLAWWGSKQATTLRPEKRARAVSRTARIAVGWCA